MSRRLLLSLPIVFGLLFALCLAPAGAAVGPDRPAVHERGLKARYSLYSRRPGTIAWAEAGSYASAAEAADAARKLYDLGFEVQLHSRIQLERLPPRPATGMLPQADTVSPRQAGEVFRWLASQTDIAFHYPADGCYARAHLMTQRMLARGLKPVKVWSFENGEPLYVSTVHIPAGHVTWRYHVAPALRVRLGDGRQVWRVIDPALFQGPCSIKSWREAQRRPGSPYEPYVTLARLGEAPVDPHGHRLPGTGYWPGPDPREGLNAHAAKMMRLYKPFQDRLPPRVAGL